MVNPAKFKVMCLHFMLAAASAEMKIHHLHHLLHTKDDHKEAPRDPGTWKTTHENQTRDCMHGYEFVS